MDYSSYIKMKAKAANTYKSNWQPRDASEVTLRRVAMSSKPASTVHQGPGIQCSSTSENPKVQEPGSGFSTDYSMNTLVNQQAGCAVCQDSAWGAPGGVTLKTCDEVATILNVPSNPVKGTNCTIPKTDILINYSCECADPGVVQRGIPEQVNCAPEYTGWNNQVPSTQNGTKPKQFYPYPSG